MEWWKFAQLKTFCLPSLIVNQILALICCQLAIAYNKKFICISPKCS